MRKHVSMARNNRASNISSDLMSLLLYVKRTSYEWGYVCVNSSTICSHFHLSASQIRRKLKALEDLGLIVRSMYGRRRLIWLSENFLNADEILTRHPPEDIGKIPIRELEAWEDKDLAKHLSDKVIYRKPVCWGKPKERENTKKFSDDAHSHAHIHAHSPSHSLYNDMINRIDKKEEVVSNSMQPPISIPKTLASSGTSSPRAPRSAIPPSFKKNVAKENVSPGGKARLLTSYDKDMVEQKVRNATNLIKKLADEGKYHSRYYQMGVDDLSMMWCEEAKKEKDVRRERKQEEKEPKKELKIEDILDIRRQKALSHPLIMKFAKVDGGGIMILEDKVGRQAMERLCYTGIGFQNEEFEERFSRLIHELGVEDRRMTSQHFV